MWSQSVICPSYMMNRELFSKDQLTAILLIRQLRAPPKSITALAVNKLKRSAALASTREQLGVGMRQRSCPRWTADEIHSVVGVINTRIRHLGRGLSEILYHSDAFFKRCLPHRSLSQIAAKVKMLCRTRKLRCNSEGV